MRVGGVGILGAQDTLISVIPEKEAEAERCTQRKGPPPQISRDPPPPTDFKRLRIETHLHGERER